MGFAVGRVPRPHVQRLRFCQSCASLLLQGAYHGRTYGAMSLTTSKTVYRQNFGPLPSGTLAALALSACAQQLEAGARCMLCLSPIPGHHVAISCTSLLLLFAGGVGTPCPYRLHSYNQCTQSACTVTIVPTGQPACVASPAGVVSAPYPYCLHCKARHAAGGLGYEASAVAFKLQCLHAGCLPKQPAPRVKCWGLPLTDDLS